MADRLSEQDLVELRSATDDMPRTVAAAVLRLLAEVESARAATDPRWLCKAAPCLPGVRVCRACKLEIVGHG